MEIDIQLTANNLGLTFLGLEKDLSDFVDCIYHILPFDNEYREPDITYLLGLTYDLNHSQKEDSQTASIKVVLPTLLLQLAILSKYRKQFKNSLDNNSSEFDTSLVEALESLESIALDCIKYESETVYASVLNWFESRSWDSEDYVFAIAEHFIVTMYIKNNEYDNRLDALPTLLDALDPKSMVYQMALSSMKNEAETQGVDIEMLHFNDDDIYDKIGKPDGYAF